MATEGSGYSFICDTESSLILSASCEMSNSCEKRPEPSCQRTLECRGHLRSPGTFGRCGPGATGLITVRHASAPKGHHFDGILHRLARLDWTEI